MSTFSVSRRARRLWSPRWLRHLLLAATFAWSVPAPGVAQQLVGRVTSEEGGPVAAARVTVHGTTLEAVTDDAGRYRFPDLPPGEVSVRASALGFEEARGAVVVEPGTVARLDLVLRVEALELDPVVVTGTMREVRLTESPVKVEVVSASYLQRNASDNLTESIQHVNGLFNQVDCGVCYTNNIRINGMEGPYTAVLIDGMPIMSSLASVYGLNGINPSMIERLEIVKGPSSTLYGTEAMGGVINVITKNPRFAPRWAADLRRLHTGETVLDLAAARGSGPVRGLVSGTAHYMDRFVDENRDGFTDVTQDRRASVFGKLAVSEAGSERLTLSGKYYYEDRFGGVRDWTPEHRGSDRVYGESIRTHRFELLGTSGFRAAGQDLRVGLSYTWHDQDSYYGPTPYAANQRIAFAQLLWDRPLGPSNDLLLGASVRHETYDDNSPATQTVRRRWIPGVFVQDEWAVSPELLLLGGLRVDHHDDHGLIYSPRGSLRLYLTGKTALRLNAGTGFRVVNLFTEDHAAYTGARDVVIAEDLEPERSWSVAANLNHEIEFGVNPMLIDLDVFYTHFDNQIVPDYDSDPTQIRYANLRGEAVTRGVGLSLNQNFRDFPLLYTLGVTFQDVYVETDGVRTPLEFSADYKAVFSVTYLGPGPLSVDWTGSVVGPMKLPRFPEPFTRPTRSPVYSVHTVQATYAVSASLDVYAGVKNLFDYTQGSPLIDPGNPFGDSFDTSYVYGSIIGRQLMVGIRAAGSR